MQEITAKTTDDEYAAICRQLRAEGQTLMPDSPARIRADERHESNVQWIRTTAANLDRILPSAELLITAVVLCAVATPTCWDRMPWVNPAGVRSVMGHAVADEDGRSPRLQTNREIALGVERDFWGLTP